MNCVRRGRMISEVVVEEQAYEEEEIVVLRGGLSPDHNN